MEVSSMSEECGQMVQLMSKTFSLSEPVPLKLWGGQETAGWDSWLRGPKVVGAK